MSAPKTTQTQAPPKATQYTLLQKIKRAGMAELYQAVQEGDDQIVALKRLLPTLAEDEEFVQMFQDEARLLSRLSHPNIPRFYEMGEAEGGPYLAMELIDGRDLSTLSLRLPFGIVAYLGAKLASALSYVHQLHDEDGHWLEVVHRDICPANIMLSEQGQVYLIDFGISKNTKQEHKTSPGVIKGKFRYMSPEQVTGRGLDYRSDIFALGVVLYELLAGVNPFQKESDFDTLEAIRFAEAPSISERLPDLPEGLSRVVTGCLQKKREDRYQDTAALSSELQRIADSLIPPELQAVTLANLLVR